MRPVLAYRSLFCQEMVGHMVCARMAHGRQRTQRHEMMRGMVGVLLIELLVTTALGQELVSRQAGASHQEELQGGTWKPWVLTSASQFRPPPPPMASTTRAEIKTLQALMLERDSAALDRINFWDVGGPVYRWNEITTDQITKHKLSPPHSARARALVNVAIYDAIIAAWEAKYTYWRPRPGVDNPQVATLGVNPHSPSYPSEHAVVAGASAAVLAYLFPNAAKLFDDLAQESGKSRLLAGVHYPSDVTAGFALGRAVASLVLERARSDGSNATWTGTVPIGPHYWRGTEPLVPIGGPGGATPGSRSRADQAQGGRHRGGAGPGDA
jgi:PAP2 superfamily protein